MTRIYTRGTPLDRFMSHFEMITESGCWIWMASTYTRGYGRFRLSNETITGAHRAAWELFKGPISDDVLVLHKCDVMPCVNPDHLFLGDYSDNIIDCQKKGRFFSAGSKFEKYSQLNWDKVRKIRVSTDTVSRLARYYNTTPRTVGRIKRNETWKES